MLGKNKVDMLSGPIFKGLISMTIPIMIMNVMQNMFNIVDMWALKSFSSETAVGAVGACGTLITLCNSLLIGVSSGANVIIAKRIGSGDRERAEKAVGTAISVSVIGGIFLSVVGIVFARPFLVMANCPEGLLPLAVKYFKMYFLGATLFMVYNFCASILRASGDTKHPMYFLIINGIVKVILTFCFLYFFKADVVGVAFATILASVVSCVLAITTIIRDKDSVYFSFSRLKVYFSELKGILYIGVPTGLQSGMYSLANVVIAATVNSYGEAATTGIAIANQFDGILYQISCATAFAATPYIAQNVGAKNFDRVKKAIIRSVFITVGFGAFFGSLSAIFSGQLSSIMSSNPATIAFSQQKMVIVSSTYFICGINEIMGGVMRGLGKPIVPTVATMLFMCLFRFPWVYFIFPLFPDSLTFLYLVWPIGWILSISMILIFYFPTVKKLQTELKGA
ncbi:MAG: MATE family efflux transporter [Ruminococcaceae bacterium]|nr:MATE family efflux transporter [Oscillospiraceae bacterium]